MVDGDMVEFKELKSTLGADPVASSNYSPRRHGGGGLAS